MLADPLIPATSAPSAAAPILRGLAAAPVPLRSAARRPELRVLRFLRDEEATVTSPAAPAPATSAVPPLLSVLAAAPAPATSAASAASATLQR
ncbi:MAG: hypothetical protein LBS27_05310 [Bifidobacteriaceae bacterium]|nr:hypothetical protein [Bifidobacteriaceae bacterium]